MFVFHRFYFNLRPFSKRESVMSGATRTRRTPDTHAVHHGIVDWIMIISTPAPCRFSSNWFYSLLTSSCIATTESDDSQKKNLHACICNPESSFFDPKAISYLSIRLSCKSRFSVRFSREFLNSTLFVIGATKWYCLYSTHHRLYPVLFSWCEEPPR